MVGVRYRRSLFPGFSDAAEYSFNCPSEANAPGPPPAPDRSFRFDAPDDAGELHVVARLLYRKIDQYLLNFMFGEGTELTTRVTELARAEAHIRVVPGRARRVASAR
jgi:hypothetical protein